MTGLRASMTSTRPAHMQAPSRRLPARFTDDATYAQNTSTAIHGVAAAESATMVSDRRDQNVSVRVVGETSTTCSTSSARRENMLSGIICAGVPRTLSTTTILTSSSGLCAMSVTDRVSPGATWCHAEDAVDPTKTGLLLLVLRIPGPSRRIGGGIFFHFEHKRN